MSVTIFGLLVLVIGTWCQFGSYRRPVIVLVGLTVFGSAAALVLSALGGASVTPADLFILFYVLRLISMRDGVALTLRELAPSRPLFVFLLLNIWICGSAYVMPRLFDGATAVFSLSRSIDVDGMSPLHPTSGNISQAIYAIGGFVVACATGAYARKAGGYAALLTAFILVTWLDIGFAVLDLVTAATHTGFLLDAVHTASYAFLTADELGGVKRISGTFSEASSFASFSLMLLGLNFPLFVLRIRPLLTGTASLLLTGLIALSTSSSGYIGLAAFYAGFLVYVSVTTLTTGRRRPFTIGIASLCGLILLCAGVILFLPSVATMTQTIINESILNKAGSDSAIERSGWNQQAWHVFLDTYGIGAGIGTTRTSSYIMLLLSNLGAVGFALFAILMIRVTFGRLDRQLGQEARGIVWAARTGIAAALLANVLVGTVYYLGTLFYVLLGIAASGVVRTAAGCVSSPIAAPARGPTAG